MLEWQQLQIDSKEVEEKLKGTDLNMKTIAKKMMSAANREVIKAAKKNIRELFKSKNNDPDDNRNPSLLKSLKATNNKRESFSSFIMAKTLHAAINEKGGTINAKTDYLLFKIDGEWKKAKSVSIPARPFLKPAINSVYETGKAKEIMSAVLDKELNKYWNK